jgi:hypothetical protein
VRSVPVNGVPRRDLGRTEGTVGQSSDGQIVARLGCARRWKIVMDMVASGSVRPTRAQLRRSARLQKTAISRTLCDYADRGQYRRSALGTGTRCGPPADLAHCSDQMNWSF